MKRIPFERLHDEMMKDPKYRRQYEQAQESKQLEENDNLLRDLAKMVSLDRLRELVMADSKGLCDIRPCNVGDTVYFAHEKYGIEEWKVIGYDNDGTMHFYAEKPNVPGSYLGFCKEDIGQEIFLTLAEVEAKGGHKW